MNMPEGKKVHIGVSTQQIYAKGIDIELQILGNRF
ncbi:MAG: hypothetical protein Nk1A_1220 [Endomicrobiia bacterium]|nr:MAG: hypothetical protein Nk1A_1220 [Endomicrobiia bacterium]